MLNRVELLTEVKEITENEAERNATDLLRSSGMAALDRKPGQRLRLKIQSSMKQLRALAADDQPTMAVVFNNTPLVDHTGEYDVLVAMYGFEAFTFVSDADGKPSVIDHRLGPSSTVNAGHNTSLSAVGVLRHLVDEDVTLHVYHNLFAATALDASELPFDRIRHFKAKVDLKGRPVAWASVQGDSRG
jgi:hypothetical protein